MSYFAGARIEDKYLLSPYQFKQLETLFRESLIADPHQPLNSSYLVNSLYFDTPKLSFYSSHKDGEKVRFKLRLRTYGDETKKSATFLELKIKNDNCGWKNRLALGENEINPDILETVKLTLPRLSGGLVLKGYTLMPVLRVVYSRSAFSDPQNSFRVNLDSDLKMQKSSTAGQGSNFHHSSRLILEVKYFGKTPTLARKAIENMGLQRVGFSKYCNGIDALYP